MHEIDVAQAVRRALLYAPGGAYNLAVQQPFSLPAMVKSRHAHGIGVPPALVRAALWLARLTMRWSAQPLWQDW